jgi:hypothetical protein
MIDHVLVMSSLNVIAKSVNPWHKDNIFLCNAVHNWRRILFDASGRSVLKSLDNELKHSSKFRP